MHWYSDCTTSSGYIIKLLYLNLTPDHNDFSECYRNGFKGARKLSASAVEMNCPFVIIMEYFQVAQLRLKTKNVHTTI
ncbi:MAG: hypothetical protein MPEBLZ_04345 [Candidatus Methanoperedens nitroreducens]|uniref:Uncharacterized protein n=1 Tax=Candidatus Methanoperedens nitratireducens TaxID=1392998 RepID=A0A0P7Z9Y8_9EURY|nr:MAG: hypothetical protein MPEBLZ_04345 [Candidatus Methanoperedens sp. BLZ1]CAG0972759.1 hypothetical protein METP2_01495 [Methanosarcinales archaeon]